MDDEEIIVLWEGMGDSRLPYERDVTALLRIRPLDRDLADAFSASFGPAVAPEPPSAPDTTASSPSVLGTPYWGVVTRLAYVPRGAGFHTRAHRAYTAGGGSVAAPLLRGHAGPPVAALLFFSCEGSIQVGTPCPVNPAIWSSLGRSLGKVPSILKNGVDHTIIRVLSDEVATILSRPMRERDAQRL